MKVLVTGSRTWTDAATIRLALEAVADAAVAANVPMVTVVHGACPNGADEIADQWVRWYRGGTLVLAERHPALWTKYQKRAGFVRNELMVANGADLCLAFLAPCSDSKCTEPKPHDSHGATHCAELADERGIPLRVFRLGEPGVTSMDSRHLADEDVI